MSKITKAPVRPRRPQSLTVITGRSDIATVAQPAIDALWLRMSNTERRTFVLMHWGPLWDIQQAINPHFG
jgi:hypothetical protein